MLLRFQGRAEDFSTQANYLLLQLTILNTVCVAIISVILEIFSCYPDIGRGTYQ